MISIIFCTLGVYLPVTNKTVVLCLFNCFISSKLNTSTLELIVFAVFSDFLSLSLTIKTVGSSDKSLIWFLNWRYSIVPICISKKDFKTMILLSE